MRRSAPLVWLVAVTSVVLGVSGAALADDIVLESYGEANRPAPAARAIPPLLAELGRAGYVSGDDVGTAYEETVSRPARSARRPLPSDFDARVQQGYKQFVRGDFMSAIDTLTPLVDAARANPAVVANDQSVRENLRLALVSLAMSQKRSKDPVATRLAPDTLQDLVRSYPDMPVTVDDFGPEPTAWYEEVRTAMGKAGRGTLLVKASEASAMLYLNERFEAPRTFRKAELLPGRYRVYVRWGNQDGRAYVAQVRAGKTTTLEIDSRLDRAVRSSGAWIGLAFATPAEREAHEARLAAAVARQLGATRVVVLGVGPRGGAASVYGLVVNRGTGAVTATQTLPMTPEPAAAALQTMARALVAAGTKAPAPADAPAGASRTEPPSGGRTKTDAVPPGDAPAPRPAQPAVRVEGQVRFRARIEAGPVALLSSTAVLATVGIAGVATASVYRASWCRDACGDSMRRNTALAVGVGVTASVLHGLVNDASLYRHAPTLGPSGRWILTGGSAAAVLAGGALIAIDKEPASDPKHTLLPGSILAVIGGVGLGAGLSQIVYRSEAAERLALAPVVSVSGDGAMVGLGGGF